MVERRERGIVWVTLSWVDRSAFIPSLLTSLVPYFLT